MPSNSLAAPRARQIMISAGEASGDAHAAHALQAFETLRALGTRERQGLPGAAERFEAFGMGGAALEAAGCELVVDNRDLSVIGFVDVLVNYPRFLARLAELRRALRARRPELLLIVDYPDFNLKLADTARALGIPVLMYVAPQVWAWRAGRIPDIVRRVDHLAVLFPFEETLWRKAGAAVTCVGHPMVRTLPREPDRRGARERLRLGEQAPLIALLPGSRPGEIRRLVPLLAGVAVRLADERPALRFVLPRAASIDEGTLRTALHDGIAASGATPSLQAATRAAVRILAPAEGGAVLALEAADVAIVASGTATLEAGLLAVPMIVVYRVAAANAWLMRRLLTIRDIALVNIVVGHRLVPEFVQEGATVAAVAGEAARLLDDGAARAALHRDLAVVRERLGEGDASARVAELMQRLVRRAAPTSPRRARSPR